MRLPLLFLLTGLTSPVLAQTAISITSADMPVAGDSLRLSQATVLPANAPALTLNGANKTWNYAGLVPVRQRVEEYGTVASLSSGLQLLVFGPLGGVNRATLASPQDVSIGAAGTGLPISNGREYYNLSVSNFRSVGFGATLAGNAVPVTYASQAQQDVIYTLPQTFGSTGTSYSYFTASVPSTGALSRKRKRQNLADAWGTLTTPYGTFQTLRVVTTLDDRDSVALGATPGGPGVQLPTRKEYKWLATGIHVPVLTVTTTLTNGVERVSGVEYRDIYRKIVLPNPLGTSNAALLASLACYPSPSFPGESLRLTVPATSAAFMVTGYDVVGKQLFSQRFAGSNGEVTLDAATLGSYRGLLLLAVQTSQGTATLRTVRH